MAASSAASALFYRIRCVPAAVSHQRAVAGLGRSPWPQVRRPAAPLPYG